MAQRELGRESGLRRAVAYALLPLFLGLALLSAAFLFGRAPSSALALLSVPVGLVAILAGILERLWPERPDYRKLDLPLRGELGHFLVDYQLGYALALGTWASLDSWLARLDWPSVWPGALPTALQVAIATVLTEGVAYWVHRLEHRLPLLWRFHALHHSGGRLNLARAGRFHFVDVGLAGLGVFVPLALMRTPVIVVAWVAALQGVLGVVQHANMRMITPPWLDGWICTPAVHRYHHSIDAVEGNSNFATTVMIFDRLFGTYVAPAAPGPETVGIANDPVPAGFWRQLLGPFRPA